MSTVSLKAHYDGEKIVLDEPTDLPVDTPLIVTVLPAAVDPVLDSEAMWLHAVVGSDAFAFLAGAGEDIYTVEDGEPFRDAL